MPTVVKSAKAHPQTAELAAAPEALPASVSDGPLPAPAQQTWPGDRIALAVWVTGVSMMAVLLLTALLTGLLGL
jgi:hypothetical protein